MSKAWSIRRLPVWQVMALYAVMAVIVLYPILVVQVPGLGDYLNHLARMHVLADINHSESLSAHYEVHWQPIPYLAMDATFVVLNQVATIYNAGRIFVGICILLPVVGVVALHFAVHRRLSLVPLTAFLFCYNYLLSWGFLNYLAALGFAIILFAGWVGSSKWPRWPRAVLFTILALALYLSHLFAFGAYCLSVGGFELGRAWRNGFRPWRGVALDWLAAGIQAVPAVVLALSLHVESPFVGPLRTSYGDLSTKLLALQSPALFFGGRADLVACVFAMLVLVVGLVTRRLRLAPSVWPAALAVGTVALCMPNWLFSIFGLDFRLPLLVVMLLIGATSTTTRMSPILAGAVLGGFLVLTAIRSATISTTLQAVDGQIADVRRVISALPRGMRLLVVEIEPAKQQRQVGPGRATSQVSMVALIDRDAFLPFLVTGISIVHPTPLMRSSSAAGGRPLHLSDLKDSSSRQDDSAEDQADAESLRVYWSGWEHKFDYLLIQHFGQRPTALPANLQPVATSSVADLYRIDRTISP